MNKKISNINLLTKDEYQQIVYTYNDTDKDYPKDKTIHQLFEEQVEKWPNNIALVFEDQKLTYKELNARSNQLARYIRDQYKNQTKKELKSDTLIALCLDRSEEMIIAILAVLKAGGAYVPIDPNYPSERIGYILKDTHSAIVIIQTHLQQWLERAIKEGLGSPKEKQARLIAIDNEQTQQKLQYLQTSNLRQISLATNLAYVIYTSGTTGNPKGVMVDHRSIVSRLVYLKNQRGVSDKLIFGAKTPYVFDPSLREIFLPLIIGARLVVFSESSSKDVNKIFDLCLKEKINFIIFVPSHLSVFIDSLADIPSNILGKLPLEIICSCGEPLSPILAHKIFKYFPNVILSNQYGPTEGCQFLFEYKLTRNTVINSKAIPVGNLVDNMRGYVLDESLALQAKGAIGELYIGGAGLARGYLNQQELTAERFIPNQFATEADKVKGYYRLYKTGDLVRWLPDGNMEYIGRNDFQVKIRGFRIELGEIENTLSKLNGIRQVTVQAKDKQTEAGTNKYLVAYYIKEFKAQITQDEIRSHLSQSLPEYMIPSAFMELESFPLTVNGKLDRKALPDPEFANQDGYVAPANELEQQLCTIWQELVGVKQVGITDDFFRIGGNSILAILVSHKMSKVLDKYISVAQIFQYKTITKILSNAFNINTIHIPESKQEKPRLSFAQERLLFVDQYEQGTNAYNIPISLQLNPRANIDAIKKSLKAIVQRHQVLRTIFKQNEDNAEYYQHVLDTELEINQHSYISKEDLNQQLTKDSNYIFKLDRELPIKVWLYRQQDKVYAEEKQQRISYLLINIHHIAFDGWSTDLLFKELNSYCHHYTQQTKLDLPELSIQYKDFAVWQRNYLTGEILETQLNYWQEQLSGFATLELPIDKARPSKVDYFGQDLNFDIDLQQANILKQIAQKQGVTLYTVLLTIFNILLFKYTGQDDLVIGIPVANRHYSQLENLIGFFVNSLPIRTSIKAIQKLDELIQQTHSRLIQAQTHQDLPFEKIVEGLHIEKDTSRHPIFQVIFDVQSFGAKKQQFYSPYITQQQYTSAKFDLSLFINDAQGKLCCNLNYATSLFSEGTVQRLANHYRYLIQQLTKCYQDKQLNKYTVQSLQILTKEEYQQLVYDYNQTDKDYPKDKTIQQLFEEQVKGTPDHIAVVFADKELTYKELNARANQLARYIKEKYKQGTKDELKPDTLIALCLDRSEEMVIAILAVLKAGGAYVPIDPGYPRERIRYILKDIKTNIVITQEHLKQQLVASIKHNQQIVGDRQASVNKWAQLIVIDNKQIQQKLKKKLTNDFKRIGKATDLAYVIYTSGTTGTPKGVMVEQRGVVSLVKNCNYISLSNRDVFMQLADVTFDAATFEIWGALLNGAKLFIPENAMELISSAHLFKEQLHKNNITVLWLTKTLFDQLFLLDNEMFNNLEYLLVGGEALNKELISRLVNSNIAPRNVINGYGPTENTTFSSTLNIKKENIAKVGSVPIGIPLSNRKAYILDKDLIPVPAGIIGELYLGGAGLARGYLNQPELTIERFIPNPFATEADKAKGYTRLYKTGDLVRWLADGDIEYIGRSDFQVKIRGYRIELGEIESAISKVHGIKQVTVQAKDKQIEAGLNKYLVAYYIKASGIQVTQEEIIKHLSQSLPDYMIPSAFVELEKFPLTINGKLDLRLLPVPEFTNQDSYVAPTSELEKQLCKIWQDVLGINQVGITDDFFRIGGDSILSILLCSKMRKVGYSCSVKEIFLHRTILNITKLLKEQQTIINIQTEQGVLEGEFCLLPIQDWYFDKVRNNEIKNLNHWNQSFIVKVPDLDRNNLQSIIPALVKQHDILRAHYKKDLSGKYIQNYNAHIDIPKLRILDIRKITNLEKVHQILTDWQNNFDIAKGPLWQIGYIHGFKDKTARIYFAAHHLIIDAVSWRILIEDIKSLYNQENLASKTTSYRQWVKVLNDYVMNNKAEQDYWESVQRDRQDYHQYAQEELQVSELQLDQSVTKEMITKANQAYHTEINDLLLTALAYALNNWNKSIVNHITLEGHGREHIQKDIDLSRTVGWFTTAYPVRLEIQESLNQSIKHIKENLRAIPNKGIGYGVFKQGIKSNQEQVHALKELPAISFNYLGQFDSQEGLWQVVREDSGESVAKSNQDSNIININGMVVGGKLRFDIVSKLSKQETEELSAELKYQLKRITGHCLDKVKNNQIESTPSDFNINTSQELLDKLQQQAKEANNAIEAIYPANSLQQGFIYHVLSQEQDDAYRVQILFDYKNSLDIEVYKLAWELAIQSHPILRTSFNWEEEIVQIIHRRGQLNFTFHDLCEEKLFKNQADVKVERIRITDRQQSFDLTKPTQLRLHLIKHTEKHYTLIKSEHHVISDGWSESILLNKVHELYKYLLRGGKPQIEEDQVYFIAQKYYKEYKQEVKKYWDKKIQTIRQVNDLNAMLNQVVDFGICQESCRLNFSISYL